MGNSKSSTAEDSFNKTQTPKKVVISLDIHNHTVGYIGIMVIGAIIIAAIWYIIRKHLRRGRLLRQGIPFTNLRKYQQGPLEGQREQITTTQQHPPPTVVINVSPETGGGGVPRSQFDDANIIINHNQRYSRTAKRAVQCDEKEDKEQRRRGASPQPRREKRNEWYFLLIVSWSVNILCTITRNKRQLLSALLCEQFSSWKSFCIERINSAEKNLNPSNPSLVSVTFAIIYLRANIEFRNKASTLGSYYS